MMNNSWNLSGDSSTYKKFDKGWGSASPEKKNAFAGQSYWLLKSSDATNMVV